MFDCSFKPQKGTRSIAYMGHVKMMAATQPFISGAISKTVNLPENATVEDIMDAYLQSWKMGLKAVAIYRDGSKKAQPLMAAAKKEEAARRGTKGENSGSRRRRCRGGSRGEGRIGVCAAHSGAAGVCA